MYVCSQHHWQIIITLTTCIADKNTREQHLQFFIFILLSFLCYFYAITIFKQQF